MTTATFTATLNTPTTGAGAFITATDTSVASIMGTSPPITVNAPVPGALPPIGPAVTIAPFYDGVPEPIVTSVTNGSVSVVASQPTSRGKNGGTAAPGQPIALSGTGSKPSAIATGHFAVVANPFAATTNAGDNSVSILTPSSGGGKGVDTLNNQQTIPNVGNQPRALAVGDFSHNAEDDLAVANFGNGASDLGSVALLFQAPQSLLFAQGPVLTTGVNKPDAIAAGNFNNADGGRSDDIAVANTGDGTVSIFLNKGNGQLQLNQQISVGPNPTAIVAGDFDGDGNVDLAVVTAGDNSVRILYGDGTGHFTPSAPILVGNEPSSLAAADLAGVGIPPDLVVGNFGGSTVSVLVNNHSRATPFQPEQTYQLHANAHPTSVALGNISSTSPAFPDIVTANADGTTSYLLNRALPEPESFLSETASAQKLFGT